MDTITDSYLIEQGYWICGIGKFTNGNCIVEKEKLSPTTTVYKIEGKIIMSTSEIPKKWN